ncbi:hypothetical protein AVEN_168672-1 [Araneus ventricosus]|uniref:Uncharacterized protein n=1 Tax=Araneus ventricosus TaxID=182803 RepID=A0A4Y2WEF3_ARAVE|nr:hypothetical protein AVEN_36015-1 [Araneus ventricosus]GBO34946.1 hypothetical protein AVEN_28830-1 [Araneus ventricosus]GBO34947.1 hypothetical protein AVEN_168672-1 [Araneus ventricosus]
MRLHLYLLIIKQNATVKEDIFVAAIFLANDMKFSARSKTIQVADLSFYLTITSKKSRLRIHFQDDIFVAAIFLANVMKFSACSNTIFQVAEPTSDSQQLFWIRRRCFLGNG